MTESIDMSDQAESTRSTGRQRRREALVWAALSPVGAGAYVALGWLPASAPLTAAMLAGIYSVLGAITLIGVPVGLALLVPRPRLRWYLAYAVLVVVLGIAAAGHPLYQYHARHHPVSGEEPDSSEGIEGTWT